MRATKTTGRFTIAGALVMSVWLASTAAAAELNWHSSLEKGLAEARQASRPLFLVTMWKDGT